MADKVQDLLNRIKMIESSGGINTNHPEVNSGVQQGQSAYGSYGLMPNTIQELINRARQQGPLDEDYQHLRNQDPDFVKTVLKARPDLEDRLAQQLGQRLLDRTGGDEDKAAYGWNMGHNIPVDQITPEKLDNSDYVQKFRSLRDKLGPK